MTTRPGANPCRRCSECIGEEHHWLPLEAADITNGDITFLCKHCDVTTPAIECAECLDECPLATSNIKNGERVCSFCLVEGRGP